MRTLKFYGASDDLFEIDGTKKGEPDEIGCYDAPAMVLLKGKSGVLGVYGVYAPGAAATWTIGLSQGSEDEPLPDWPVRWKGAHYSVELEIDVPDDVNITQLLPEAEE